MYKKSTRVLNRDGYGILSNSKRSIRALKWNGYKILPNSKRSQSMMEFLSIFIAVFLFFVLFMLVLQENSRGKNLEKESILAKNIVLSVQDEINLAYDSPNGYYREFSVSKTLLGKSYDLILQDNIVYINASKIGISYRVMPVNGTIKKGSNVIRKENGVVFLN
ncbi:MAG: hypothetical protein WC584_05590 [Candidatus Pacearchaeota archaeon]